MFIQTSHASLEAAVLQLFHNDVPVSAISGQLTRWEQAQFSAAKLKAIIAAEVLTFSDTDALAFAPNYECEVAFYLVQVSHTAKVMTDKLSTTADSTLLSTDMLVMQPGRVYALLPQIYPKVAHSINANPAIISVTATYGGDTYTVDAKVATCDIVQACAGSPAPLRRIYYADRFCGVDLCPEYFCEQPGFNPLDGTVAGIAADKLVSPADCCLCDSEGGRFFRGIPVSALPSGEVFELTVIPHQRVLDFVNGDPLPAPNGSTSL